MNDLSRSSQSQPHMPLSNASQACCRSCSAPLQETFIDLGMIPLVQSFLKADALDEPEKHYPLHVRVCSTCRLVQLRNYVAADEIFSEEYPYFSSYSSSWVAHAKAYCETVAQRFELGPQSQVVEIASNDGYLLQHFLPLGIPVLGVEPAANVAAAARAKGIPVVVDFFGERLANELASSGKSADLIAGNNVFAHVPDANDFAAGMKRLLKPEGVVTLEFPHLQRLIAERQFDTIYHEHYSYFSLLSARHLLQRHGLEVFDVEELTTHGGSLRVYAGHEARKLNPVKPSVAELLEREQRFGLDDSAIYEDFRVAVQATKRDLLALLIDLKRAGKRIVGYGAPGKGNTLLNYCGIGTDFLDFTVDRNPHKHGMFTPGTRIPVLPVEVIDEVKPDYVLILPWNLKTEIIQQMCHISGWGGKFIVPIPEAMIVDPGELA